MSEYDFNEIFDEIHALVNVRNRQKGEFTAKEYAARHDDKTTSWAHTELKRAIEMGIVTSRKTAVNGHHCVLYKRITES